jgi:hypothetical protein
MPGEKLTIVGDERVICVRAAPHLSVTPDSAVASDSAMAPGTAAFILTNFRFIGVRYDGDQQQFRVIREFWFDRKSVVYQGRGSRALICGERHLGTELPDGPVQITRCPPNSQEDPVCCFELDSVEGAAFIARKMRTQMRQVAAAKMRVDFLIWKAHAAAPRRRRVLADGRQRSGTPVKLKIPQSLHSTTVT